MSIPGTVVYNSAVEDFKRARRAAAMQQMMARLTGKSADLLAYDDVCRYVKSDDEVKQGVREISLDAIVGSVGRYQDFTRTFWPKHDSDEERWVGVKTAVNDMSGMPPIDVYKVGDVYFVIDGNHRVSIARQLGSDTITARVQLHVDRGGSRFVLVQEEVSLRPGDRAEYEAEWTSVPLFGGSATPGVELDWRAGDLFVDGDSVFVLPLWVPVLLLVITVNLLLRAVVKRNQEDAEPLPQDA